MEINQNEYFAVDGVRIEDVKVNCIDECITMPIWFSFKEEKIQDCDMVTHYEKVKQSLLYVCF